MKKSSLFVRFNKSIPSLISAILLAIVVWVLAVTSTDPVQKHTFGRPVPIEIFGLDSDLVITSEIPDQISLSLSAPVSTWETDLNSSNVVRAIADLSELGSGTYSIPINLQIDAQPVKVESYSPDVVEFEIEEIYSEAFTIELLQPSSPAIGYEASTPTLNQKMATINGPASLVDQVVSIQALLDISQAKENINTDLELKAIDENGLTINGVTIFPTDVNVKMDITQRGGYRTVSVKVVTIGDVTNGYDLAAISYNPIVITVFSTDPNLVNELPGFIETQPLNLNDASEDMVVSLPLNLPTGMTVVGESTIRVAASISPIRGSLTMTNLTVETFGLDPKFTAKLSPQSVDIILSGPLPTLDELIPGNIRIVIDLTGFEEGKYQLEPSPEINVQEVLVQSLLPAAIEVEVLPIAENPGN
jgi:YbbR domain-containing protein